MADLTPARAGILLVDETPAELVALRATLDGLGLDLVAAASAESALAEAARRRFAAVVLGLGADAAGGLATAARLRAAAPSRATPILVLAEREPDAPTLAAAYELGGVDLLRRPVAPRVLQAKVRGLAALFAEAERTRREADQLRMLVHGTRDYAIFMLDPEGRVVTWNPGAERLKGWAADEIVGRHFSTFYPQEVVDRGWPEHELRVAAAEGRFEDEGWRLRKDGSRFWANVVITALRDDDGRLRGFSKVTRDLTARKQAEEAARQLAEETAARRAAERDAAQIEEQRERLHVTLASIGDAVITTDREGRIEFLNPIAERLVGWTSDEAAGRPLVEVFRIVNEQTRNTVENPALRALAEGVIVGLANHTLLLSRDGSEHPIDDSASPIRDAAGNVIGSVLVFRDIGARRRAERELREQTLHAETLVRVGSLIAREVDLHRLVQTVTDEATRLCGAQFGAFFYNVLGASGEAYMLYTLSGVPREAFAGFPMPRNTEVFEPTFRGEGVVRSDDITRDPRYGRSAPYHGMPPGHLPVRSYLAVPVVSSSGEVLGGLFFGHAEVGVFGERHERLLAGVAGQAAVAIDNARLYQRVQASADRLSLALGAADLGDWSWDATSDAVTFSERAARVFGFPDEPPPTWTAMQERLHPDDRERARREVERVIAERGQYDIEYRVMRADGTATWVGVLGRAIYGESGGVAGMYGVVQDIGERKRLEQSLRDSEARFRSLMEQAPFSIQVLAPDGRTLRANRAWEELWGVTREQLGDYSVLADPQLEARGVLPLLRRAFAGEPVLIPAIRYDPDETIADISSHDDAARWVAAVAYPVKDDSGAVREVVLVHDDVTARRRAEAALGESEERLQLALAAGRMGVWDWNVRSGELRWSDSLEPLHGLAPGTFRGTFEHFQQLIHPLDREAVGEAIDRALAERTDFYVEFRNVWQDGSLHWIAGSGRVFTDADGAPQRMIGLGLDVTARKRSEQTARFLAEASATLAGLVDFDSTLQKVASLAVPHFADWVAVDVLEPAGTVRRVAVAHVDPAKVALAHELHRRLPADPQAPHGVWHILRSGSCELYPQIAEEMLASAIPDPQARATLRELGLRSYIGVPLNVRGRPRGVLTFVAAESGHTFDATDLAVAQDLAHRAAIAIENGELYEELRRADRSKDEFLATLAHELRNPLAPIRNGLHVFRLAGPATPAIADTRAMMERQVDHLVRLVDDLLDVSRITRDRLELRRERVALADVVHNAIETSRPLVEQAGHTFALTLPATPVILDADPVRLAQVVSNLLNNAAKYTPPGGRIALVAEVHGGEVVIRVRDNGLGIPAGSLTRVFEMFSQVDSNLTHARGGLGIGLTLVKRLVEMHGGAVAATSDGPGRGSEFVVTLPLPAPAEPPAVEREAAAGAATAPSRRILVVDDNHDAAESLAMMLGLHGHDVRTAFDGAAALVAADAFRPEIVLLDIGLPGMDGYEVCRRLRRQESSANACIVALTGWGQEEDRRRSEQAGFDHHLVKPVETSALLPLLARGRD